MDYLANISVPCDYQQEKVLSPPPTCSAHGGFSSSLDELLSSQTMEADVSLEWLSVFVEDCFSSSGNCLPPPADVKTSQNSKDLHFQKSHQNPLPNFTVPGKPRSKRSERHRKHKQNPNRQYGQNLFLAVSLEPPPLLDQKQTHWFAGSELVSVPKKEETNEVEGTGRGEEKKGSKERRCSHCLSQRTPQWRAGPLGPKTLCNACGVRYKSGRLLPEYRPAKSPTFVSFLHSNSHKKVMEMRSMTALL